MLNYYKSINDNSATDGANTLKIFAMSKNQIWIVNNSDDSTYILELIAILTIKNGSFSHFFINQFKIYIISSSVSARRITSFWCQYLLHQYTYCLPNFWVINFTNSSFCFGVISVPLFAKSLFKLHNHLMKVLSIHTMPALFYPRFLILW